MTDEEIRKFAGEWIAVEKSHNPALGNPKPSDDDPSWDTIIKMLELTRADWRTTLAVCVEIARQTDDPWVLQNLGAGPLEDILEGGQRVIEPFLAAAKANPTFRKALHSVWECSDPEAWRQFQMVRDHLTLG